MNYGLDILIYCKCVKFRDCSGWQQDSTVWSIEVLFARPCLTCQWLRWALDLLSGMPSNDSFTCFTENFNASIYASRHCKMCGKWLGSMGSENSNEFRWGLRICQSLMTSRAPMGSLWKAFATSGAACGECALHRAKFLSPWGHCIRRLKPAQQPLGRQWIEFSFWIVESHNNGMGLLKAEVLPGWSQVIFE